MDYMFWFLNNYQEAVDLTIKARTYILENMSMNARAHEYSDLYEEAIIGSKQSP